mmetsp:Transcript_3000/g.8491  ORF Transcript_3000/g.8491 Transcript_3000/m.8491 type:complete len:284 (-) Transcript_3000:6-857(-)
MAAGRWRGSIGGEVQPLAAQGPQGAVRPENRPPRLLRPLHRRLRRGRERPVGRQGHLAEPYFPARQQQEGRRSTEGRRGRRRRVSSRAQRPIPVAGARRHRAGGQGARHCRALRGLLGERRKGANAPRRAVPAEQGHRDSLGRRRRGGRALRPFRRLRGLAAVRGREDLAEVGGLGEQEAPGTGGGADAEEPLEHGAGRRRHGVRAADHVRQGRGARGRRPSARRGYASDGEAAAGDGEVPELHLAGLHVHRGLALPRWHRGPAAVVRLVGGLLREVGARQPR